MIRTRRPACSGVADLVEDAADGAVADGAVTVGAAGRERVRAVVARPANAGALSIVTIPATAASTSLSRVNSGRFRLS